MVHLIRTAVAGAALAVALCTAAQAAPVTATIRVESVDATLIPQTTRATDARDIVDDTGAAHAIAQPTAMTLLLDAAGAASVPIFCTWFPAFSDCYPFGIGRPLTTSDTVYWRLVMNGRDSMVGAIGATLTGGESALFVETDFTQAQPPILELAASSDKLSAGTAFTATVTQLDTASGTRLPAGGATVAYGAREAVADGSGRVTFLAEGAGTQVLAARRAGATRAASLGICSYGDDPTVCSLPPKPVVPPVVTPPLTPALPADVVPPSSRVSAPRLFTRLRTVTRLAGTVAPDRSDIARVEFALARRVGTLCRFRQADGRFAAARSCTQQTWIRARGGANWTAKLGTKLAPGGYRVFSRAVDGSGNVERTLVTGASSGSFTVVK